MGLLMNITAGLGATQCVSPPTGTVTAEANDVITQSKQVMRIMH